MNWHKRPDGYMEFNDLIASLRSDHGWGDYTVSTELNGFVYVTFPDGYTVKLDCVFTDNAQYSGYYYAIMAYDVVIGA